MYIITYSGHYVDWLLGLVLDLRAILRFQAESGGGAM